MGGWGVFAVLRSKVCQCNMGMLRGVALAVLLSADVCIGPDG